MTSYDFGVFAAIIIIGFFSATFSSVLGEQTTLLIFGSLATTMGVYCFVRLVNERTRNQ